MKKTKLKISIQQIIRRLIQLVAFILLPGLFISAFGAFKDIFSALIQGTFSYSALSGQLWLLIAVIPITVLMGRFFCGYLCAFGTFGDVLWFISNKIHKRSSYVSARADRILKKIKYILLILVAALGWTGIVSLGSTSSPWTIFGMYFTLAGWPTASYLLSVGAALLLLMMIGSFFIERFFCRYLCPLGAIFSIISLPRLFRIKKPNSTCGACTLCTKECAMGIPLSQMVQVTSGECINCFQCVDVCPRHTVKADPTPALATTMATTAITGLYFVGNLASANTASAISTIAAIASVSTGNYKDGVYTGSASGFRGTTEVQVTVKSGEIEAVEILSTNDDAKYVSRAQSSIISNILISQSTDVPAVSGATFSSNAIINAVKNALESSDSGLTAVASQSITNAETTETAAVDSSSNTTTSVSTAPSASDSATSAAAADTGSYTDGVYTGTGSGFRGNTDVSVTVSDGMITAITAVSYQDDEKYFSRAESTVISSIICQQSVDVSTVSGATFSSNGLIEAVADALSIDFTNPNSTLPHHKH